MGTPPLRSGLGCLLYADRTIPVVDAVSRAADVYMPKAPGRYPQVVVFARYSKELQTTGTNETGSQQMMKPG